VVPLVREKANQALQLVGRPLHSLGRRLSRLFARGRLGSLTQGRRWVVVLAAVVAVAAGASTWGLTSSSSGNYRTSTARIATVVETLDATGSLEPVNNAQLSFQVDGQVATVPVSVGQQVTAGEVLATLDTSSLVSEVDNAESAVTEEQQKLTSDETSETTDPSSTASSDTSSDPSSDPSDPPSQSDASQGDDSSQLSSIDSQITAAQSKLTSDQHQTDVDNDKAQSDLAQANTACAESTSPSGSAGAGSSSTTGTTSSTTTGTASSTSGTNDSASSAGDTASAASSSSGSNPATSSTPDSSATTAACTSDLQQVLSDQTAVSNDEQAVAQDESGLAKLLQEESSALSSAANKSSSGSGAGSSSSSSASSNYGSNGAERSDSGSATGNASSSSGSSASPVASPYDVAADQATIDADEAQVTLDQESLNEAQLVSPISGTVASIGFSVGNTVSAGSSTEQIVVIGPQSFQVSTTVDVTDVSQVKTGQEVYVIPDGRSDPIVGKVTQVGPPPTSSSSTDYPVVITLPTGTSGLFDGATASVSIVVGQASHVVTVPTSAVHQLGHFAFVSEMRNGNVQSVRVTTGAVGPTYTEITSGIRPGDTVVLANLSEPLPTSSTGSAFAGVGALEGGGGSFHFVGGGGGGSLQRTAVAP
jgi:multidrug efflux pump subunit AcrA (membrane-fusion protein)